MSYSTGLHKGYRPKNAMSEEEALAKAYLIRGYGNVTAGHIITPKALIGKRVRLVLLDDQPEDFESIEWVKKRGKNKKLKWCK